MFLIQTSILFHQCVHPQGQVPTFSMFCAASAPAFRCFRTSALSFSMFLRELKLFILPTKWKDLFIVCCKVSKGLPFPQLKGLAWVHRSGSL